MRFVNIAHGDFIVLLCFALLVMTTTFGLHPVSQRDRFCRSPSLFGLRCSAFCCSASWARTILLVILVTFGFSIIIQNGLLEGFGANPQKISAAGWRRRRSHWDTASTSACSSS